MRDPNWVDLEHTEALAEHGLTLLCRMGGREVWVPLEQVLVTSDVQRPGDRGTLTIPRWVAVDLGLEVPNDRHGALAFEFSPDRVGRSATSVR